MTNQDSRFIKACKNEQTDCTPVWFMRQAGRYLPEYRKLRKQFSLLELCRNPDLATEITMQPIRRFDLDAAIIFAPAGELVPVALRAVAKGGVVVCGGIHMSDIPSFPYEILWGERVVRSVANLTRRDGEEFLALAPQVPVGTEVELFPLEEANEALERLRRGEIRGAAVLVVDSAGE